MPYPCPVCGYPSLPAPARDYEICPSCGTEFEYHDARRSHEELRQMWIHRDAPWHSRVIASPVGWNPWMQLIAAGYARDIPPFFTAVHLHFQANARFQADALGSPIMLEGLAQSVEIAA